ncbi:hypothetical protein Taro_044492 [Colocasia esculenta]|uniref:BZIP domain-containing protein n=1 Tax=Colocasia esculenta TaxID=4460 RepID=A0A843X3D8_COLES|nr:hypothetical protein [Colocasia esculenta]
MVSSSGSGGSSGSGSALLGNSGSEGDLRQAMDQRRQRRMLSNRESARRSRMRKQKHLDDLTAQVAQLRRENNQALASYRATTQQGLAVEAENAVLRTQIMELSSRLESLNEIVQYMNGGGHGFSCEGPPPAPPSQAMDGFFMSAPWSLLSVNQPIMASPDLFQY